MMMGELAGAAPDSPLPGRAFAETTCPRLFFEKVGDSLLRHFVV
jgi:hypothetical protein